MATVPERDLDYEEQRARIWRAFEEIEKISAETRKIVAEASKVGAETRAVPYATIFQGLIAVAGLLGAGAAIAKVFFP
ncbi:MAG: hypothetical protein EOP67_05220 [Sphingomonas sp.]|nr:MAG: hypothetical protein EOP67_05220 [Sphingomonas sp.]